MSETVHYKGKLKLILETADIELLEDVCKALCSKHYNDDLKYDSWSEQLQSELYNLYVVVEDDGGKVAIYEVLSKVYVSSDTEIFVANKTSDNEYDYEVMYYNGGMGFSEAIEESLNGLGG